MTFKYLLRSEHFPDNDAYLSSHGLKGAEFTVQVAQQPVNKYLLRTYYISEPRIQGVQNSESLPSWSLQSTTQIDK